LRGEFSKWRGWQRTIPAQARKLLVTLGGSDHENVTLKSFAGCNASRLQIGKASSSSAGATRTPSRCNPASSIQHPHPSVAKRHNMPELMAEADLAIAAGGTTAWELAFMGLPALMIVMADNQRSNAEQLDALGAARNLRWHADLAPEKIAEQILNLASGSVARATMSETGRRVVDGLGNYRVWFHLNEDTLSLRPANADDARLIWEWASDPTVRAVSFTSVPIPWETHVRWFDSKLSDRKLLSLDCE
jgi:spore coat polysaccharide biosynthesis predicted glycosyltransferase SpsG